MSKEVVLKLFDASAQDQALQEQINTADSLSTVVNLAAEKGYEFTEDELRAVVEEAQQAEQDRDSFRELDDSELSAVAGGYPGETLNCPASIVACFTVYPATRCR